MTWSHVTNGPGAQFPGAFPPDLMLKNDRWAAADGRLDNSKLRTTDLMRRVDTSGGESLGNGTGMARESWYVLFMWISIAVKETANAMETMAHLLRWLVIYHDLPIHNGDFQ